MRSSSVLVLVSLLGLAVAPYAGAVGTRVFELDSLDDLSGGDLKGVSVDSSGKVRAGLDLGAIALDDATSVFSALAQADGTVLLGTGSTGKILRISAGQSSVFADTGQLVVTSLAVGWNKSVLAGTIPNGRIMRLDASGKPSKFVDLDAKHVWALAFDPATSALFAATGPDGKLFRIDATGKAQVYYDSEEPHLTALALGPNGSLYAGSSGQGLLYKVTGPGRATVLYDPPGEEVRAIVTDGKGTVWALANEYGELPELPKRALAADRPAGPVGAPRPKPGKGTLLRITDEGLPEKLFHRDDTHFVSLALGDDGRAYVGTGVEGRVYAVEADHVSALVADTDERQVGAMVLTGAKRFIATSDPPVYHEIRGIGGPNALWTSKVLDTGLRARFGRVRWRSTGPVEISARTGNTKTPDATWSDWGAPITEPGDIRAAPARFVQVRARFARDPRAVLSSLTIPFVTDNLRAVVTSVDATPRNTPPKTVEGQLVPPSGGELAAHSATIKLTWKVDNPDSDALRYRLSYRLEGQSVWRDLTKPDDVITKTELDWDTSTLPEGTYRVRVEASDEMANPPDRAVKSSLESQVIQVDNTPPVFKKLTAQNRRILATVTDGLGPIARVDIAFDGRPEWRPVLPKDGVFDEREEDIDVDVSAMVGPGDHMVAVRAFDQAANYVVRSIQLR
jgi:hypothetical protein